MLGLRHSLLTRFPAATLAGGGDLAPTPPTDSLLFWNDISAGVTQSAGVLTTWADRRAEVSTTWAPTGTDFAAPNTTEEEVLVGQRALNGYDAIQLWDGSTTQGKNSALKASATHADVRTLYMLAYYSVAPSTANGVTVPGTFGQQAVIGHLHGLGGEILYNSAVPAEISGASYAINGAVAATPTATAMTAGAWVLLAYQINGEISVDLFGRDRNFSARTLPADVALILGYSSYHTNAQVTEVVDYINTQFGLSITSPATTNFDGTIALDVVLVETAHED